MTQLSDKPTIDIPLHDLFVAPENMRHDADADDDIAELGQTLLAGQIQVIFVRPAPESVKPYAILDGRRRFLAWQALEAAEQIEPQHPVKAVVCDTPEEIAAATVVNNHSRKEVENADYLLAVNRLTRDFKAPDTIARILGIEPKRVRQLAKLGSVDPQFLQAYKNGNLNLVALRNIARITDPAKIEELLKDIAAGVLYPYKITDALKSGVRADSAIAQVVGVDAYLAGGGTIEQDLFEETPDVLTDVTLVNRLWVDTVRPVAEALKAEGIRVWFLPSGQANPDGCRELPNWAFTPDTPPGEIEAATEAFDALWRVAQAALEAGNVQAWQEAGQPYVVQGLARFRLRCAPLEAVGCTICAGGGAGLNLVFYVDSDEYAEWEKAKAKGSEKPETTSTPVVATRIDTDGYQNGLHEKVTRIAGQGLAFSLSQDAIAAFHLQLAAQFIMCAVERYTTEDKLLQISVRKHGAHTDPLLKSMIDDRLQEYVEGWKESGMPVFTWVEALEGDDKGDLFALLTAIQIDTREAKTNMLRPKTRAEAALVAEAIGHDIADFWLPDAALYAEFGKQQLLGFLDTMKARKPEHAKMKREELAPIVAEAGKAVRFVPAAFNFELADIREVDGVTVRPDATIYRIGFNSQNKPIYPRGLTWRTDGTYAHVQAGGGWGEDDLFQTEADFLESLVKNPLPEGYTRLVAFIPAAKQVA